MNEEAGFYLRKSASICGSFAFLDLYSRQFVSICGFALVLLRLSSYRQQKTG